MPTKNPDFATLSEASEYSIQARVTRFAYAAYFGGPKLGEVISVRKDGKNPDGEDLYYSIAAKDQLQEFAWLGSELEFLRKSKPLRGSSAKGGRHG